MIRVNSIVQNACQRVGIVGDGQAANENQAMAALNDLKAVITDLNTQNLILENYQTVDFRASKSVRFAKLPKGWFTYTNFVDADTDLPNRNLDEVCKIGDTYYFVGFDAHDVRWLTNDTFQKKMEQYWPDVVIEGNLPDRLIGCARKLTQKWIKLYPGDKTKIDSFMPVGRASMYCTETEYANITVGDTRYDLEYFHIEFNTNYNDLYRITYLETIDDLDIDDVLYYSSKYQNMIEDGLCMKLCMRYKFLDSLEMFENEYEIDKRNIKVINDANRPEVYENFGMNDFNYGYEMGFAGEGW